MPCLSTPANVIRLRVVTVGGALLMGLGAAALFLQASASAGLSPYAYVSAVLLSLTTAWLAWGALLAVIGLVPAARPPRHADGITGRTVILMPVCNEEPAPTFARIVAMYDALKAAPAKIDIAILSDTQKPEVAVAENYWFARVLAETGGEGRIFYRRRDRNIGRKAGNIADFFRRSGGAYDYAVILDADSLMDAGTVLEMIRRIESEPRLGLLQTLPVVVRARSVFGRAMQFSAAFCSPVFSRGLARLQGHAGPFWGHNAIVRVNAWTECCGLPELPGPPPLGGHILSHDVVEAALLVRGGWTVRVDTDLEGSFEEGPETLTDHAKRDRRWCQGNLQHSRILGAEGLAGWSRFSIFLGILAYVAPLLWAAFLVTAAIDRATLPAPDYFPDPHQMFPVFPSDGTAKAIGLAIGIVGLLIMPKFLILIEAILTGRIAGFGGPWRGLASTVADLLVSSLIAPALMAFQSRSVIEVLRGVDWGWPTNRRGSAALSLGDAFASSRFIFFLGIAGLALAPHIVPGLWHWLLPVLVPMALSPLLIVWTSRPFDRSFLFLTPTERQMPEILRRHDAVLSRWINTASFDGVANLPPLDEQEWQPMAPKGKAVA